MLVKIRLSLLLWLCCILSVCAQTTDNDSVPVLELEEIVVSDQGALNRVQNSKLGSEKLELTILSMTPQAFGESDIIKSISLLPGVRTEAEGSGGFEVRGGNAYQNLVTMDGMTLYNPSHLMGIFSTFNEDAMSRATLHKGPVPATFGGASSAVLETYMKPGAMEVYHFTGSIGILNAKVAAEGPIIKDKLSFAVSARKSYLDLFLNIIPQYKGTVINFYDVNAKVRYNIDRNNILDLSFFMARDNLAVTKLMELHWGNLAGSLNWFTRKGDWNFNSTLSVTDYTADMGMNIMDTDQSLKEYIRSFSLNENANYEIAFNHNLELGFRSEIQMVKSGDLNYAEARELEIRSGWQNALWAVYEGSPTSWLSLSAGIRGSLFSSLTGNAFHDFIGIDANDAEFKAKTYFHIEPRISVRFSINEYHNIKAGYSITTQYIHGLRSVITTFPFDRYAVTSAFVKPEITYQYVLGYAGMTENGAWDWSVEGYYKSMRNVYDYKDGVSMFSNINLESLILSGNGRSYGLEIILRKNAGRFSGWLSYTLSKTESKIPGINNGKWYAASNDHRNDIAVVGLFRISDRWNCSASWTYSSGRPLTAPDVKYELNGMTNYYYSARNSYKTPPSHRLDISATYTRIGKKVTSIVAFGIFNLYNHYSPYVIYFEDDATKPSGTKAIQRSLFGVIPSVSYTIKF